MTRYVKLMEWQIIAESIQLKLLQAPDIRVGSAPHEEEHAVVWLLLVHETMCQMVQQAEQDFVRFYIGKMKIKYISEVKYGI